MKRYRKRISRRFFNCIVIFAALLYSGWFCVSGFQSSAFQQIQEYLIMQVNHAAFLTLEEQADQNFVSLRRDSNHDIIAVTVNGILLSQLQMQYQNTLESTPSQCNLELHISDLIGGFLFSWIPGRIRTSCTVKTNWDASIISRTIEENEHTIRFQLILVTNGTAKYFSLFDAAIHEELMLYETTIYTTGT